MNLKNRPMESDTFLEPFFPPVRLSSNCWNFFHLESRIAKADIRFKNFVTRRGGGVLPTMHYTGGLPPKGVPFSGFRHSLASISYLKDRAFTTGIQRLLLYVKGLSFPSSGYLFCQKWYIKAGKGLDHGADPPAYKTLLSSPPPPLPSLGAVYLGCLIYLHSIWPM